MVLSLLCETKCDAEGVTTSSSRMLADSGTSSERASDNDIAMDYETGGSTGQTRWNNTRRRLTRLLWRRCIR